MRAKEPDIFKALAHPIRRKILKYIAEKGKASYKELTQIEPKPGVLYHHLRMLRGLISQDDKKMYYLTKKGKIVYEFLISESFVEPSERSFHKFITPRFLFELLENKLAAMAMFFTLISTLSWQLTREYILVFMVILPYSAHLIPNFITALMSWILGAIVANVLVYLFYKRRVGIIDLIVKFSPAFLILNIFPLIVVGLKNPILVYITYFVLQFFGLSFLISAISVAARLSLRASLLIVITLHYTAILICIVLLIF